MCLIMLNNLSRLTIEFRKKYRSLVLIGENEPYISNLIYF